MPYFGRRSGIFPFTQTITRMFPSPSSCRVIFIGSNDGSGALRGLGRLRQRDRRGVQIIDFSHGFNGRDTVCTKLRRYSNRCVDLVSTSLRRSPTVMGRVARVLSTRPSASYMYTFRRAQRRGGLVASIGSTFCGVTAGVDRISFISNTSSFHAFHHAMQSTLLRVPRCFHFSGKLFD